MDLVVWSGPVAKFQVPGATVPGAQEKFFGCRGDVTPDHPHCPSLANSWLDAQGRRIPQMLASMGLSESDVDNLYLGAFSAGGSIVKRLLLHPADRAMVKAVMLSDAAYTSGPSAPHAIEGYVRYLVDLTKDPSRLFVSTTSASPNGPYGSAADTMRATMAEASAKSGVPVDETPVPTPIAEQPEQTQRLTPNVIHQDFGMTGGGHGFHPKIAPAYWQKVLVPFLVGQAPPPPPTKPGTPVTPPGPGETPPQLPVVGGPSTMALVVSVGAGVVTGWALASLMGVGS